ncbi:CynX/NimT family MFS transporter [Tepidamorphus sp. 3E244]|uniref:MFS transporter n=1 Tax=Tepidamorphus sp. 3E244 TaxID=3385498 RepID=UPI0038FD3732
MNNRWRILALLFCVRVSMAFQFQAVAALSPLMMDAYSLGLADIGLMIGLYLSPGIVLSIPGGAIGRRYGEKSVVLAGLALMAVGGLLAVTSSTWDMQIAGRILAGIGGVLLNVLMTKMVADWFAGREVATAMGIFVNSWPVGIALALVVLPPIALAAGLMAAMSVVTGLVVIGFIALGALYRAPSSASAAPVADMPLRGVPLYGVLCAGAIWGLFNSSLGMIFGFGPAMLSARGWSATAASSTTSIVLWLVAISVPFGGFLADRIKRNDAVLATGLLMFTGALLLAARSEAVLACFVLLGLVAGLAAGPIMSLPSRVLVPGNRSVGMGVFYAVYYGLIFIAPYLAGLLSEWLGRPEATFDMGAALLVTGIALLALFRKLTRQSART